MDRIAGFHPVREALRARRRRLHRLRVRAGLRHRGLDELLALAGEAGIPVESAPADALAVGLPPGLRDQGVVLDADPLSPVALEHWTGTEASGVDCDRVVVLDGVEDPQNLGALIRVAEASGASGVVLGARHSPPLGPVVARASAGALEHLPICRAANLRRALADLRDAGFWLLGADAEGDQDLYATPDRLWQGRLALVFGAEGQGLRPGVASLLDHRLRIPLRGRVGSLNVATAAAVVCFEAARRSAPLGAPSAKDSATSSASVRN
jgi:23S rRNA (guanosine2251-2'-O)-methyltransferase